MGYICRMSLKEQNYVSYCSYWVNLEVNAHIKKISSRNGYFLNLLQSLHHVDTFGSETLRRDEVHGGRGGQVGRRRAQEVQRRRRDKDHGTAGLSSF